MNFIDGARRGATKFFCIHIFVERRCPNQMMRDLRECCHVGLRSEKIEPAINLKRVRADNFGAYFMRDIGSQLGLAGGGRPDNKERSRHMTHKTYRTYKKSGDVRLEAASPDWISGTR